MKNDRGGIIVSAQGEAAVTPDLALVTFAVSGDGKELAPTREDVNKRSSDVLAALRRLKVSNADISAPDVGIHPQYDYRRGQKLIGYRVSRQMQVKVRDLDRLGEVMDAVVAAGANEVFGAQMSAADPSAAEHAALEAAVAAARAKAEVLAAAAGVKLGRLARIEEDPDHGVMPMPKMRMMGAMAAEAADGGTEVATGDLTVTRSIRAWFELG
ncbi:MAG TPA: SIMPL domain-containing protein [Candidatus Limnocylindria bacterium]|nr:SIMPL domain-containing protein [Candidatus Limnocylindria bacterium]